MLVVVSCLILSMGLILAVGLVVEVGYGNGCRRLCCGCSCGCVGFDFGCVVVVLAMEWRWSGCDYFWYWQWTCRFELRTPFVLFGNRTVVLAVVFFFFLKIFLLIPNLKKKCKTASLLAVTIAVTDL